MTPRARSWSARSRRRRGVQLLALYDRNRHGHTPFPFDIYKPFFLCELAGRYPAAKGYTAKSPALVSYKTPDMGFLPLDRLLPLPSASRRLLEKLGVSTRLRDFGIKKEDIPVIVKKSKGGSRNFSPIDHSDETVARMLIF
jgi:hypothetical protein